MEWGCMQALIDYDGWRKWKDINKSAAAKEAQPDAKKGKGKSAMPSATVKREKRLSTGGVGMVVTSSGSGSEGNGAVEVVAGA